VQKCCRNNDRRAPEPLQRSCLTAPDQLRETGENEGTHEPGQTDEDEQVGSLYWLYPEANQEIIESPPACRL
jgi:hypothetical protein